MSTLRLTTISNQTGSSSVPSDTVINGSAKAWVNFNGSGTVAIRASFNVSSITDNGVGDYTVNFTVAFADTNYAVVGGVSQNTAGEGYRFLAVGSAAGSNYAMTASSVRVQSAYSSVDKSDATGLYVAAFR